MNRQPANKPTPSTFVVSNRLQAAMDATQRGTRLALVQVLRWDHEHGLLTDDEHKEVEKIAGSCK